MNRQQELTIVKQTCALVENLDKEKNILRKNLKTTCDGDS